VFWPGEAEAADQLATACLAQLHRWGVSKRYAEGALPAPATYGVPDCWPHVRAAYERAGFVHDGRCEIVLVADVSDLPRPGPAPVDGLEIRRTLGSQATGFGAYLDDRLVGFVEVRSDITEGGVLSRLAGWGEICNQHVEEDLRRRGVGTWLYGHVADWLRLGGVSRLIDYDATDEETELLAFLRAVGFRELTRTLRRWQHGGPS
jgi:GNAT superfamily N-acetyltransferase